MSTQPESQAVDEMEPGESAPPSSPDLPGVPSEVRAVNPPNRNGYATVMGRIADIAATAPADSLRRKRTALLTKDAEEMLRDADQAQLGARGIALAKHGAKPAWRAFIAEHFRLKYELIPLFDAPSLRVE